MQYDYDHYDYIKYKGFEIWRDFYRWSFHIRSGTTRIGKFKKIEEAKDFIEKYV